MYLEIDGFDEYADVPSPENQLKLQGFAAAIAASEVSPEPIQVVNVIGHADRALKLPVDQRQAKEMEVSVNRAEKAAQLIRDAMAAVPGGAAAVDAVQIMTSGVGSRQLKVQSPASEADMRKNRRVEITTASNDFQIIHVLPDWPREPDDDNPTLEKVFSIKLMEGVSAGEPVGVCTYTFVVWDKAESRAGVFVYIAAMTAIGVSSPFAGESDWADLLVGPDVTVEDFTGSASHAVGAIGISVMVLNTPRGTVTLNLGLGLALNGEAGAGPFSLDGAVKPFTGD
jgi:hypothetical protein